MQLKIYGEKAKKIKEGQTFTAKIGSVEGSCVVTLESVECAIQLEGKTQEIAKSLFDEIENIEEYCPLCYEPLGNGKSHGSWCK